MKRIKAKDPLGSMLLDYLDGKSNAFVEVESDNMEMERMTGKTMFRSVAQMDDLETMALSLCHGHILDVGAGSGCHSLYLQDQGMTVDSLDISPGCIEVMRRRGVQRVVHKNLFSLENVRYTTILMLMNGIGICETLEGLNLFLQFLPSLLDSEGQLLAESTALHPGENDPFHGADDFHGYYGETEFIIHYGEIRSDPFGWLYVDFHTLNRLASFHGLHAEKLCELDTGRYLARITQPQKS